MRPNGEHLGADEDGSARLDECPRAEVLFNYLGRFDPANDGTSLLVRAVESAGDLHSPRSHRSHLLEINSAVSGDRLRPYRATPSSRYP